jgi:hypothetical protein
MAEQHTPNTELVEAAEAVLTAWSEFLGSFDYVPGIGDRAEDLEFGAMNRLRAALQTTGGGKP